MSELASEWSSGLSLSHGRPPKSKPQSQQPGIMKEPTVIPDWGWGWCNFTTTCGSKCQYSKFYPWNLVYIICICLNSQKCWISSSNMQFIILSIYSYSNITWIIYSKYLHCISCIFKYKSISICISWIKISRSITCIIKSINIISWFMPYSIIKKYIVIKCCYSWYI